MNSEQVTALLREAERLPDGAAQIAAAEEAMRQADALDDPKLRFAARMGATEAYERGGEPAKAFVTFSWSLAEFDRNPGYHDRSDDWRLRWQFKYVCGSLTAFPEVPLDRTLAVLDDMERRYRAGGHSLHAVYTQRFGLARHLGDDEAAAHWYDRWQAAPRDENSDCAGCDPTTRVHYLYDLGRSPEAVALAGPVLDGRLTCRVQPEAILTALMLPLLRVDAPDRARDAHLRAYRRQRDRPARLDAIAQHVRFCVFTGNDARALELVRRHLDWLDRAPSPYAAMEFAAAAAAALRRVPDARIHRRPAAGGEAVARAAGDLAEELGGRAEELAARFDARNGTDYQSGRVAMLRHAGPLGTHVPLTAVPTPAPGPAGHPKDAGPAADAPVDVVLDELERRQRGGDTSAVRALVAAHADRLAAAGLDPVQRARLTEARGWVHIAADEFAQARACWGEAADGFRAAGDDVRAHLCVAAAGLARCVAAAQAEPPAGDETDAGLAQVRAATAEVVARGTAADACRARLRLALALVATGDAAAALPVVEAATAPADEPELGATVALRRMQVLAALGREDEVPAALRAAYEAARGLGGDDWPQLCLAHAAHLPEDASELDTVLDEAVAAAVEPDVVANAHLQRARHRRGRDRAPEAVADYVAALGACVAAGATEPAAFLRAELADAYLSVGRPVEAAELAEEALPGLVAAGAAADADRCRYLLVRCYRELGESAAAVTTLDELAGNLSGFDLLGDHGQMREEAGVLLYRADRDAEAAVRFRQAADAYTRAGLVLPALRALRQRAGALHWAQDPAAPAALAEADAAAAALPPQVAAEPEGVWETAMLARDGAQVLIGADALDAALARVAPVASRLREIEAFGEALSAELVRAEILLRLGRAADAEPVLRELLTAIPRDAPAIGRAAGLLAGALAEQGRQEEAEKVAREYDLA
ncbi:hypothetical protein GCM10010124_36490 [Pilimelia terevasa]|uniref:Tetratricopeptide repeat protein n=1 Tax=Pilimelia terevasa TaxID=53372 RepID=A0A8J3BRJ4_9ACTN|nr:hypothetical protein [Pilimelia terevasa]GGK40416.1 hypothetical protein GCM10010124_36490 [Pilimelia terevasa]